MLYGWLLTDTRPYPFFTRRITYNIYIYVYVYVNIHIHIYETCSIKEFLQLLRRSESNPQPSESHVPGVWYLATTCAIFAVSPVVSRGYMTTFLDANTRS